MDQQTAEQRASQTEKPHAKGESSKGSHSHKHKSDSNKENEKKSGKP